MSLSQYKIKELEFLASGLKLEPDTLVEALISLGFKEPKQKEVVVEEVKKLTPEEKVEAIEEEALNKGWTYAQLWTTTTNSDYSKKGLVYFVTDSTTIGEVTEKHIVLLHERPVGVPVINNFYNMLVEQPWVTKVTTEENKGVCQ
ncbi:MAG: hypothetical protein HY094_02000 [Candidatus Melainabacteria bacterium]|nr:hypothetical protein [Candidatus Melainabacteria bacterium]